jgi:hypothetical protein
VPSTDADALMYQKADQDARILALQAYPQIVNSPASQQQQQQPLSQER